jgi:hypothetical protein
MTAVRICWTPSNYFEQMCYISLWARSASTEYHMAEYISLHRYDTFSFSFILNAQTCHPCPIRTSESTQIDRLGLHNSNLYHTRYLIYPFILSTPSRNIQRTNPISLQNCSEFPFRAGTEFQMNGQLEKVALPISKTPFVITDVKLRSCLAKCVEQVQINTKLPLSTTVGHGKLWVGGEIYGRG